MSNLQCQTIETPNLNHSLTLERYNGRVTAKSNVNGYELSDSCSGGRSLSPNCKIMWIIVNLEGN